MSISFATRQVWSIWAALITMQHKKPLFCRLCQPVKSCAASADPPKELELINPKTNKEGLLHQGVGGEVENILYGLPFGGLCGVTRLFRTCKVTSISSCFRADTSSSVLCKQIWDTPVPVGLIHTLAHTRAHTHMREWSQQRHRTHVL
ncbi:hypothetical protein FKM82_014974 [Ascaphus truei]